MSLVVDASVALDWVFASERSERSNRVLEDVLREGALVPPIWPAEVANGLLSARRRGKLEARELPAALALFEALQVTVLPEPGRDSIRLLVDTGGTAELTAYDAAYLELALRESAPLATHDEALRHAAQVLGAPLFEFA
jgi:predicted nucleic acid-binding protein